MKKFFVALGMLAGLMFFMPQTTYAHVYCLMAVANPDHSPGQPPFIWIRVPCSWLICLPDSQLPDCPSPAPSVNISLQNANTTVDATTDTNGTASIDNIPRGTYEVEVSLDEVSPGEKLLFAFDTDALFEVVSDKKYRTERGRPEEGAIKLKATFSAEGGMTGTVKWFNDSKGYGKPVALPEKAWGQIKYTCCE